LSLKTGITLAKLLKHQEIYKIRVDGSELQNLSENIANDFQLTWFTDKGLFVATGEWIAFTSDRDGNQEIYLMNKNGSD
jgi:TolB protein